MGINHMLAVNEVAESIVYKKTDCVYTQAMLAMTLPRPQAD